MNARSMICASAIALAGGLGVSAPAHAALTLIAVGGGGGGFGRGGPDGGVISESGTSVLGGGAGGIGGLGGAAGSSFGGGGGAGWLGNGGTASAGAPGAGAGGAGGLSAPTFAGGVTLGGNGGFGGGGASASGGGGGGGYSGGGGGNPIVGLPVGEGSGGGGGSYLNPALRDTIETPDFNGTPTGLFSLSGYVIVGLTVFNYTGTIVEYTIPTTGFYYVAAVGAQGGDDGGYGAGVGGSVLLDAGTELDIVVGGAGTISQEGMPIGSGGGGSFVWDPVAIPAQPVPEPSTWGLMLLGFAGLGYAGWRSQRKTAAPAG